MVFQVKGKQFTFGFLQPGEAWLSRIMFPSPVGLLGDPGLFTVPLTQRTRFGFVAARIPS